MKLKHRFNCMGYVYRTHSLHNSDSVSLNAGHVVNEMFFKSKHNVTIKCMYAESLVAEN